MVGLHKSILRGEHILSLDVKIWSIWPMYHKLGIQVGLINAKKGIMLGVKSVVGLFTVVQHGPTLTDE